MTTDIGEYCAVIAKADLTGQNKGSTSRNIFTSTTDAYCVAQFFIYEAEDMGSWVYGVNRYGSSSSVAAGLVDIPNYDGVKAFQYSIQRTVGDAVFGRKYEAGATTYGANPTFKERGKYYGLCTSSSAISDTTSDTDGDNKCFTNNSKAGIARTALAGLDNACPAIAICDLTGSVECVVTGEATDVCDGVAGRTSTVSQQLFMGDGREDDSATALSTVTGQKQKYTRCLVCHGSQEFTTPQAQSSGKF